MGNEEENKSSWDIPDYYCKSSKSTNVILEM